MKLLVVAALTLAVILAACGDNGVGGDGDSIQVVATTSQIAALTKEIAGERASISTLIRPGVDAHDFEPSVDDVQRLGQADLILRNGIGLDDFLDGVIEGADSTAPVVTVTDGIELAAGESGQGDFDPHVWQDPLNVKVMVDRITDALAEADPESAEVFRENAAAYQEVLDETDAEIRALIEEVPAEDRKMVTNHDAFGYFIRRYGLEYVGAVIPSISTQAEPSAQQIAELADLIKAEGVKAIFAENSIDPAVAEQLAADTGVTIVDDLYSDSLGEPGSGADTVHGMLLTNARKIAEALK